MNIVEVESHDDMFHVVIVFMIEQFDLNIRLQRSKIISISLFLSFDSESTTAYAV